MVLLNFQVFLGLFLYDPSNLILDNVAVLKRFMLCFLLKLYYVLGWNIYVVTVFYSRQCVFFYVDSMCYFKINIFLCNLCGTLLMFGGIFL